MSGEPLTLTLPSREMRMLPNGGHECAKHTLVSAAFSYSSGGFPMSAVLG